MRKKQKNKKDEKYGVCADLYLSQEEREIEEHRERGHIVYYEIKREIEEHRERKYIEREKGRDRVEIE